ncbi:hypothetical protein [Dactylosporangium matsuzakiense]|uniref:hypothetical protein n=1 Tax=Dactylosporangium matsuzakiense TaxID=53360 RepID=UPI0021C2B62D|nr:hypothetical protein [Dactylosporangium matsuzakiense]UWZ43090.1 hypothetical protein Dmats_37205 [Dactylosporangium matsuzakiense]
MGNLIAFTSRRLMEDESLVPGYVYHDPEDATLPPSPDGRRASGWNLLVGDETDEQLADAGELLMPDLEFLTERYPEFGKLVAEGCEGRQFEWDADTGRYTDVGPSTFPED